MMIWTLKLVITSFKKLPPVMPHKTPRASTTIRMLRADSTP